MYNYMLIIAEDGGLVRRRRYTSCLWLHIYLKASEALLRNKFDFDPFAVQPKRPTSHLLPSVGACPSFILSRPHDPVLKRYD